MAELRKILGLTAKIVSAHLSHNQVLPEALPKLIHDVCAALARAGTPPDAAPQEPAVPIRRSVFPDHIVCLEDGKHFLMLKRHLKTHHAMTPEQYREKWKLPGDYPMTAPNYGSYRSKLAKEFGLGRKADVPADEPGEPAVQKLPARRARGSKG